MGSAVLPDDTTDPSSAAPDPSQLATLPTDLREELKAREGEMWVRGFTYAPEQHGSAWLRDRCDGTTYDFESLPAPSGLATAQGTGGSLAATTTYSYQVTATNAAGATTPCAIVTLLTVAASGTAILTWAPVSNTATYSVYGRVAGSIGLIASGIGPFDLEAGKTATYTDTGVISPGAAPPSSNTTGGPGTYTNLASPLVIPYIIETMDTCSAFGWEERDFKGRALRWLDNATPQAIESEFWNGTLAQAKGYPNNFLTNSTSAAGGTDPNFYNATPGGNQSGTVGTPTTTVRALQILQDYIANAGFGGQGMIHVQPQTAPNLLGARRVGKLLLDVFDNIIVPGSGYNGTGPIGYTTSGGDVWIYATDLVMVRSQDEGTVFPDTFSEAMDRGQAGEPNTITFRAERFAVAYWDSFIHAGVCIAAGT